MTQRTSPTYISTKQVAARFGKHVRTVERWRRANEGPPFLKIGGGVFYELRALELWEARDR